MKESEVKIGMYVFWKGDIEEIGTVVSLPDKNGYVSVEGPDTEQGPQMYSVHYSDLEEE